MVWSASWSGVVDDDRDSGMTTTGQMASRMQVSVTELLKHVAQSKLN